MIHKIFTIHDAAAGAYLAPFFLHAEAMAIRTFSDCINDDNHQFGRHPKDYNILCLGEFDDNAGTFEIYQTPKPLGNGLSFVQTESNPSQLHLLKEAKKS